MRHAVQIALSLDDEMLRLHGVSVASPLVPNDRLPACPDLADQLGGRYLIKYLRKDDRMRFASALGGGVTTYPGVHYLTPTAICEDELESVLALPPLAVPRYALFLDPRSLNAVGPRAVRSGRAVEYILLNGFTSDAIVPPGWPRKVS